MAPTTAIVRYTAKQGAADENQRLIEQVLAELDVKKPDGIRYSVFRLDDGVTFVHVAVFDGDGNPLTELTAFQEFAKGIADRCVEPPAPASASMIGAYRAWPDGPAAG
jgi:hypothetical protein